MVCSEFRFYSLSIEFVDKHNTEEPCGRGKLYLGAFPAFMFVGYIA